MQTFGKYGWCGTCYSTIPGEPGFCKQHGTPDNKTTNTIKASEDVKPVRNPNEFSRPTPNENWGFCSENCLKLGHNNGYSEVNSRYTNSYTIVKLYNDITITMNIELIFWIGFPLLGTK